MPTPKNFRIPEKALVPIVFTSTEGQSTEGKTVTVKLVDPNITTPYTLGTGSGAAPGTDFSVTLNFSGVPVGKRYELQAAADITGSNPITVIPNANTSDRVYVEVYSMDIF